MVLGFFPLLENNFLYILLVLDFSQYYNAGVLSWFVIVLSGYLLAPRSRH